MQIESNHVALIKKIIGSYCPKASIKLFGSRANNTATANSDIDILIEDSAKIPLHKLTLIKEDLSETAIPYTIDVVDWWRISEEFRNHIAKTAVEIG